MKYNVFVSYRRTSFESANLIAEKMRSMGYSVFFDVETLRAGNFNEQLFDVIDNCDDFILVLPPNALDKCNNEDDWVRKEVLRAIAANKNIIPVILSGFSWPDPMPQGMEDLANYQAIIAGEQEFFDMSMKRLASYLKSKPNRDLRKFYKKTLITLSCILLLAGLSAFSVFQTAKPLCNNIAMNLTGCMGTMNLLYNESTRISNAWNSFIEDYSTAKNNTDRKQILAKFEAHIDHINNMVSFLQSQLVRLPELSQTQTYLLGIHNVQSHEVSALYQIIDALFYEITVQDIGYIKTIISEKNINDSRYVECYTVHVVKGIEMLQAYLEATFCAYSELMSRLPKSAQEFYNKQSPGWSNFPYKMGLNLTEEEFQSYENTASKKAENALLEIEKAKAKLEGEISAENRYIQK